MMAARRVRWSRGAVSWAACSALVVVAIGGGVSSLVSMAAGSEAFPVWREPSWWTAAGVFLLVLCLGFGWARPTVRRFLVTSIGAAVLYLLVGSALLTVDSVGTEDPNVAGSGWGSAMQAVAVFALRIYGNGAVAFVAPLALGLLPAFRGELFGQPARWSNAASTQADEDAAAEDFSPS